MYEIAVDTIPSILKLNDMTQQLPLELIPGRGEDIVERAIRNISLTQKEDISTQLNLGVRYFDFRPGHYAWDAKSSLFHQHNVVPGCSLDSFCHQIIQFLEEHESEVVVVSLNTSGFANDAMKPEESEVIVQIQAIIG